MANYDFVHQPELPAPAASEVVTAPLPPSFVSIPNIYNFRHLGTHILPSGSRTRRDLVYRSAEPSRITSDGISALQELGVKTIYDLRSLSEIERHQGEIPVTDIPGTTRISVPVFGYAAPVDHVRRMGYYGEEGSGGFVKAYMEILEVGKDAYRPIFVHLRDKPNEPFLVHCTAGKDRTGVVIALILSLVEVSDQEIAEEYALTELGLAEWYPTIIEHIIKDPTMQGDRGKVERMVSAKEENMLAFLDDMKRVWGSAGDYLVKGLGFSEMDVLTIKKNITEER